MLEQILGEDSTELSHLLEALDSGAPPHAGIALGKGGKDSTNQKEESTNYLSCYILNYSPTVPVLQSKVLRPKKL